MHDSESDVAEDPKTARAREAGGGPDGAARDGQPDDSGSTTGTGRDENFVGRVAGVDDTYAGETGAEARGQSGDRR